MTDKEKVIKGLTHCTAWAGLHECQPKVGDDCPYVDEPDCKLSIMYDALILLKKQEPVEPIAIKQEMFDEFYGAISRCPKCDCMWVMYRENDMHYCPECGQAVKWE